MTIGRGSCFSKTITLDLMARLVSAHDDWAEVEAALYNDHDVAVVLPVYLMDHSGLSMSTHPFGCRWDSNQVGFVYATNADMLMEYGTKDKPAIYAASKLLEAEVSTYNDYLQGDVYGYVIVDEEGEHLDSCWGFIGDADFALSEGVSAAKHL